MFRVIDGNPYNKWSISSSKIHGNGIFTNRRLRKGTMIGIGIEYILGFVAVITDDFGSMINHSYFPNAELRYSNSEGVWNIYTLKTIPKNEEILIDYNNTPWFIQGPMKWYI